MESPVPDFFSGAGGHGNCHSAAAGALSWPNWEVSRPMNVVERGPAAAVQVTAPATAAAAQPAPPSGDAKSARSSKLRPLKSLLPYVGRYRGRAAAAFCALLAAALATLAVPLAVRRMIDFGFS